MALMTVKEAVLRPALRAVVQSTDAEEAMDEDFEDAFNFFIQMLDWWRDRGIDVFSTNPPSMNAGIGTEDPIFTLWTNLVLQISSHFNYDPTMKQSTDASRSFRVLRNRQLIPARMSRPKNMPRGSGNTYYRNWICVDDCDEFLESNGGAPLLSGT